MPDYHYQDVMEAWREWMRSSGLAEWQIEWFMRRGYPACIYLWDAVHA